MKTIQLIFFLFAFAVFCNAETIDTVAGTTETAAVAEEEITGVDSTYKPAYHGDELKNMILPALKRFEIGWRVYDYDYDQTRKGTQGEDNTYFGSIFRIEKDHDAFPGKLLVRYRINDYFGVGITHDTLHAVTRDIANRGTPEEHPGTGDGTVELEGFVFYGYGRYAFENGIALFAELGIIQYDANFAALASWEREGRNKLNLDDTRGTSIAGGCEYSFNENLTAEIFIRQTDVDVDGEWLLLGSVEDPDVNFDLSNLAYGAGLRYSF